MTQVDKRASRISNRARKMRTRVRDTRREIERIAKTPTLGGLFLSFLKIGTIGFGGGLAVIAQIRTLAVQQRRWLTDQEFASGFALAQTLPGTAAGNVATYVGLKLRGWRGAGVSISGFILPSMLMMIVLAILYRHLRYLPDTDRLFSGLNAAVVALIIVTAWRMGRNTLVKPWQWLLAVFACIVVAFFSATVIEVVLAAGLIGIFIDSFAEKQLHKLGQLHGVASRRKRIAARVTLQRRRRRIRDTHFVGGYLTRAIAEERVRRAALVTQKELTAEEPLAEEPTTHAVQPTRDAAPEDHEVHEIHEVPGPPKKTTGAFVSFGASMPILAKVALLLTLSTIFLRIGSITFGGGFVMIPLIEAEVVDSHHWLTHQEFVDATALGQITPGPVLITATFIGYRTAGTLGALVATISIFLPSFLMMVVAGSSLARFHTNKIVQSFLKGVTPAVVGLLVAAGISIGRAGIHSWEGMLIAVVAGLVLIRFRPNAIWVILGAGVVSFVIGLFFGA
ncbi:MAG TPA: chromate transporter [Pyrinomonadaceae bacterium]|nr:chromate transporter [Pyrinomonadaceae bacterium]